MRRIFFEKDEKEDYLFVIIDHERELDQIYKVDNFTDETGREYVYTLIGERKNLKEDIMKKHINSLDNGKFRNFNGNEDLNSALESIESMIDSYQINKDQEIFIYYKVKF